MEKTLLREWLLKGERRAYSMIMLAYGKQFVDYKPKMFRKWLAAELSVPEEKINISSLNSSFRRNRKNVEKQAVQHTVSTALPSAAAVVIKSTTTTLKEAKKENKGEKKPFIFSVPEDHVAAPRIEEF